jgi:hypothetical protein
LGKSGRKARGGLASEAYHVILFFVGCGTSAIRACASSRRCTDRSGRFREPRSKRPGRNDRGEISRARAFGGEASTVVRLRLGRRTSDELRYRCGSFRAVDVVLNRLKVLDTPVRAERLVLVDDHLLTVDDRATTLMRRFAHRGFSFQRAPHLIVPRD